MCGSLPLHIASRNGCDVEILKLLFEAFPEALEKKNSTGDTPMDSGAGHVSIKELTYFAPTKCSVFSQHSAIDLSQS